MTLDIVGDIDDYALPRLEQNLASYNGDDNVLDIRINSYGGYVDVAQEMCERIIDFATANDMTIRTSNTGDVMSAATLIFLMGEERTFDSTKGGFLIHNPWAFNVGDSKSMYECGDALKSIEDYFVDYYAMTTTADKDTIRQLMDASDELEDSVLSEYHFAKIVESKTE